MDSRRWVASGGPGDGTQAKRGYAQVNYASVPNGTLYGYHWMNMSITPFLATTSVYEYGYSTLAAHVAACAACTPAASWPAGCTWACGQELLIGAPGGAGGGPGAVYLWRTTNQDNLAWQQFATLPVPSTLGSGSRFGHAMASAQSVPSTSPWATGGLVPSWIAVSAPGADRVFVYDVNTSAAPYLVNPQELVAPIPGRGFGKAMAAGDFDGDGIFDLAVAGPDDNGTDLAGYVWLYRGRSHSTTPYLHSTAPPLQVHGLAASGGSTTDANDFGASLAAGRFVGSITRDALLVGAPMADDPDVDDGAVCQYVLAAGGTDALSLTSEWCFPNDFTTAGPEYMGSSVAVGNYYNYDSSRRSGSPEALLAEVAVGFPGMDDGATDAGEVVVFLTDDDGIRSLDMASEIYEYLGTTANARFGERMSTGYLQATQWQDLAVGAPFRPNGAYANGSTTLTKAVSTAPCPDLEGDYETLDAMWFEGNTPDIRISTALRPPYNLQMTFLDDSWIFVTIDGGTSAHSVCSVGSDALTYRLSAGTTLDLEEPWTCGATSQVFNDVDLRPIACALGACGDHVGDVTLAFDATTGTLAWDIDLPGDMEDLLAAAFDLYGIDEDCELYPLANDALRYTGGVCE